MNELLFSNLDELVVEKENISATLTSDKWQVMPYELGSFKGKMLHAGQNTYPQPVTLKFNVKGWHKVYLGLIRFGGEECLGVQNSNTKEKTIVNPQLFGTEQWLPCEWAQEVYFKSMDFSKNDLTIFKTDFKRPELIASILFVKLVPMTEKEIQDYTKTEGGQVSFHFDMDYTGETTYDAPQELTGRIEMLQGAWGGKLMYEFPFFKHTTFDGDVVERRYGSIGRKEYYHKYGKELATYLPVCLQKAHDLGYEVYATCRVEMGDFVMPNDSNVHEHFVHLHPDCACYTRDGRKLQILSYAYPEVRKLAIDCLLDSLSYDFDGISLIFKRGMYVAFEQPVIDRVKELYGVDARTLPFADPRLHTVLGEFMTTFLRELKAALKARNCDRKINVIVFYDPVSSRNFGLDVETWAKEGLIDSVSQGLMKHYEDLTNCLKDDGTIDLEAFKAENAKRAVVKRYFSDGDISVIVNGAKEFKELLEGTGVEFMATLTWEFCSYKYNLALAKALREIGINNFLSWNSNHKAKNVQSLQGEKIISRGQEAEDGYIYAYHRVMSLDDKDISSFSPNWRG